MRGVRRPGDLDFGIYLRGAGVLAKAPQLVLPIVGSYLVVGLVFGAGAFAMSGAGLAGSFIISLIVRTILGFGLGLTLIGADLAWRNQPASLPAMFEKAKRKFPDIFWATIAFSFVQFAVQFAASFLLGPAVGALGDYGDLVFALLSAATTYFIIYTMPAAVNGGIPGMAALNASVLQARSSPWPTLVLTVVYVVMNTVLPAFAAPIVAGRLAEAAPQVFGVPYVTLIVEAIVLGICVTFSAVMMAKVYDDLATRRFFFGY